MLASESENTITARCWDVFWQLSCRFAAIFLATGSILSKVSEHLLSSQTTKAAIFSIKMLQAVETLCECLTDCFLARC